jgi:RNA polymerase sigma-70 factor (ECF subfamily)
LVKISDQAREAELNALRPDMVRFAKLQLRDAASAEDAVQEAMIAAVSNSASFSGRSSYKTWVFSILRFKVIDIIRSRARETSLSASFGEEEEIADLESELFDARGHWNADSRPSTWNDPESAYEQEVFWKIFEACLDVLPEKTARVFSMRELLGLDTDEICKELNITATNCWVVLHRARQKLRVCLDQHWFSGEGAGG